MAINSLEPRERTAIKAFAPRLSDWLVFMIYGLPSLAPGVEFETERTGLGVRMSYFCFSMILS